MALFFKHLIISLKKKNVGTPIANLLPDMRKYTFRHVSTESKNVFSLAPIWCR